MAGIKTNRNKKLKSKFRFVVLNDETFEEKVSLSLSSRNVWVFLGVISFTLIFLTAAAIIYTPLKYFIPGFGDYNYRSQILQLKFKTDSLEDAMQARSLWLNDLADVVNGTIDTTKAPPDNDKKIDKSKINLTEVRPEDRELRREVEDEENYSLSYAARQNSGLLDEIKEMHLASPVDGYVTDEYSEQQEHYGIDIATTVDAPVKAVLDGKVISAAFNLETGYVLEIQHKNNLVSIYKHNSRLVKKTGDAVKAGEVVAFAGSTGELSTGPHLHFELWRDGKSLNPKDYIVF
jgi:murein DD-endopeptidase MepM/ murein hydrolase activator NlpD